MTTYRYILASNKIAKIDCPKCGQRKHWQLYIDQTTGEVLPERYGRCDNSDKCGAWNKPEASHSDKTTRYTQQQPKPKVNIPAVVLESTLTAYQQNCFVVNLVSNIKYPFLASDVLAACELFQVGTNTLDYLYGAATFPFINQFDKVRFIQVKQFDKTNHTTDTNSLAAMIKPAPDWIAGYNQQDTKVDCLFGEHLLKRFPRNPIFLFEAPKTAIISTLYYGLPSMSNDNPLCLATYNKSTLTNSRLHVLNGRNVEIFPDLSAHGSTFEDWKRVADAHNFATNDLLERNATPKEKEKGLDLADFLIKCDWRDFRQPAIDTPKARVANVANVANVGLETFPKNHEATQPAIDTPKAREIQAFVDEKHDELKARLADISHFESLANEDPNKYPPEAIDLLKQARNVGYGAKFKALHRELNIFFASPGYLESF